MDDLVALVPDAVMSVRGAGRPSEAVIVGWNRAAEELYGFTAEEAIGRAPMELLRSRYPTGVDAIERELAATGAWDGEIVHRHRDGHEVHVEARVRLVGDDSGDALLVYRDLSIARATAAQLARRTRRARSLERMLELSRDAVFTCDAGGRITSWNDGAQGMLGWTPQEAIGRVAAELLRTRTPIPREEIVATVATEGFWEGELDQTARDGRSLTVASRWAGEHDESGGLVSIVQVNRDITERLQAVAEAERERLHLQLERTRRLEGLGLLAGGIAHDFNNLLGVIVSYASFVESAIDAHSAGEHVDLAQARADAGEIHAAADRAARLTRQLLAYARQDPDELGPVDVAKVVTGVREMLGRTLGPGVELDVELAEGLPSVRADEGQLEQVLVNLAVNARDAMPGGGRLVVRADLARPDRVRIEVRDSGTGMAQRVVERAFEPFFTTKEKGSGTGLGLATSSGIVARFGGELRLTSEVGAGTTATVLLPTSQDAPGRAAGSELAAPGGGEHVLVVDDEPLVVEVARRVLTGAGYEVTSASDGSSALQAVAGDGHAVDLVLTDVLMPGIGGPQLADELARAHPGVPVLFMTGYSDMSRAGEDEILDGPVLRKPFTPDELLLAVRTRIDARASG